MIPDNTLEQIRPGVWSFITHGPGTTVGDTNGCLVERGDTRILIDPGWGNSQTFDRVGAILDLADHSLPLTGVVATHAHPDHAGAAEAIAERFGGWVAMGVGEAPFDSNSRWKEKDQELLAAWGSKLSSASNSVPDDLLAVSAPNRQLAHQDKLAEDLEVILTPGHSDGHICVVDHRQKLIFSGDHVLPHINPHVLVSRHRILNPLGAYLGSLDRVTTYDDYLVCPGHEGRFDGIRARVRQLKGRIERRNDDILMAVDNFVLSTVWDVASAILWRGGWEALSNDRKRLALGLTASHIELLVSRGFPTGIRTRP